MLATFRAPVPRCTLARYMSEMPDKTEDANKMSILKSPEAEVPDNLVKELSLGK